MDLVKMYYGPYGGLMRVWREAASYNKSEFIYTMSSTTDFCLDMTIGGIHYKLEAVEKAVRDFDKNAVLLSDLGDYPLFGFKEKGVLLVSLRQEDEYRKFPLTMKAKDVPVGSKLLGDAFYFFKHWKGGEAVDRNSNKLLR